jgi:hypothetical protein
VTAATAAALVVDLTDTPERAGEIAAAIESASATEPFGEEVLAFCADFSRRLGRAAKGIPELAALAFWMRKSELVRLREQFSSLRTPETLLVPRGTVLHIPPANVDTIFIYSWLLSLLVGNKNVIRLSTRRSPTVDLILEVMADVLADEAHAALREQTAFVRYGHQDEVTARLSAVCDVRVIWGGDATVRRIRATPLPPHATELTFPDRFSMAVIRTDAYLELASGRRDDVAESFFNDAYWFDQMGCSSPRIVHWVGGAEISREAAADFYARVRSVLGRRNYAVDTAVGIRKMTFGYQAVLDHPVNRVDTYGNELTVVALRAVDPLDGDFPGAGTFFDTRLEQLTDLAPTIRRRDQTLSHFGFSAEELRALAVAVNGRGIDRMVPFGQALTFNRYWDGHDLLQSFSRRVFIQAGAGGGR